MRERRRDPLPRTDPQGSAPDEPNARRPDPLGTLLPAEQSLIAAVRAAGSRSIRVETRGSKIRDLEIEEAVEFDGHRASLGPALTRLLAEAPHQEVVVCRRDGRLTTTLRRILRFRFP